MDNYVTYLLTYGSKWPCTYGHCLSFLGHNIHKALRVQLFSTLSDPQYIRNKTVNIYIYMYMYIYIYMYMKIMRIYL